jgi:hypothetical protein
MRHIIWWEKRENVAVIIVRAKMSFRDDKGDVENPK